MKILYCKTSYMKYYNGTNDNDIPENGGSHVQEFGYGHEEYNFSPVKLDGEKSEVMLGFFETKNPKKGQSYRNKLHIENIKGCENARKSDYVDDILVVWCATKTGIGVVVTGWYRHATVYRNYQSVEFDNGYIQDYNVLAKKEDCTLLPWQVRGKLQWQIPRSKKGFYGQAFQWFGQDEFNKKMISYIDEYDAIHKTKNI